jgi:hypothetical protein
MAKEAMSDGDSRIGTGDFSTEDTAAKYSELENLFPDRVYVSTLRERRNITRQFAEKLKIEIEEGALEYIAQLSEGRPRNLLKLLVLVRDFAERNPPNKNWITTDCAEKALKALLKERRAKLVAQEALKVSQLRAREKIINRRQAISANVRREVWRRDEGRCVKCGSRKNLEYDHIIPISKGAVILRAILSCFARFAIGQNRV